MPVHFAVKRINRISDPSLDQPYVDDMCAGGLQAHMEGALVRRLEAAWIRAPQPELFYQCEDAETEPYPGGTQVRVKLDAGTGEFLCYAVDRYSDLVTRTELTQEQALQLAASAAQVPTDAVLASFRHAEYAPQRRLVELTWWHVHEGLRVDGDSIRVVIHPDTGRVVEVERFWRTVQLR